MKLAIAQVTSGTDPRANLDLIATWAGRAA